MDAGGGPVRRCGYPLCGYPQCRAGYNRHMNLLRWVLTIIIFALAAWLALGDAEAADAPRCPGIAPICHLGQSAICLCSSQWRSSCEWRCVVMR